MIDLRLGDCIEVMRAMPDNSVDAVVTDPPYMINYKTNYRNDSDHRFCKPIENDSNPQLLPLFLKESYRVMKANTAIYIFCSPKTIDLFKVEVERLYDLKNIIIWVKDNWTAGDLNGSFGNRYEMILFAVKGKLKINGKRHSDVWVFDRVPHQSQLHQNQKPASVIVQAIRSHSKRNDTILDPFMGSGTTGIACIRTNRNFIGIEKDPDYFKIAQARIEAEQTQLRCL